VTDAYQQLLWDLEESLDAEGHIPLYTFSWWLRGQERGLTEEQIAELCQRAYDAMTAAHDLHLEWIEGSAMTGRRADPDTPLDFDINSTGKLDEPFLALVPDGSGAEDEVDP
jgi:hypothetical protein